METEDNQNPTRTATPLMAVYKEAANGMGDNSRPRGRTPGSPETSAAPVLPTEPPVEVVPTPEPTPYRAGRAFTSSPRL